MYEHAYHIDFGAAAGAYVDAFMANIDWAAVVRALPGRGACGQRALRRDAGRASAGALLLDVRRAGVFEQARAMIPRRALVRPGGGGRPGRANCRADREVVVYCVYGHEVGRATALRLRAAGLKARYLRGGIDGWQSGRPCRSNPRGGIAS